VNIYTTDIPRYLQTYGLGQFAPPVERSLLWMANRARTTLAPTAFVLDELRRCGFPRVEVWGRGVDTDLFHPSHASAGMRERLSGGQAGGPLALFVGRLAREKNVAALHEVIRSVPCMRLAIVGDGPARAELESRLGGSSVVFTGYLRGEELATAFASADMFLFPSESETFGQVVLQAMASGLPPIVIAGSAPAELVPCGIAGLHVAPGRPAALAHAAHTLAQSPTLRRSMSTAAVECARRYSWPALIDRMEALLGAAPQPVPANER
jgi:glycosyltransferase involved in cell wall biosynthesis